MKIEYRKVIRKAKELFYRSKIEKASNAKDVFHMAKWHKSRGTYCSSPLRDPRHPDHPPSITLAGRRDILLNNLLLNVAVVGDIPMEAPTVPLRSLPLPPLTREELKLVVYVIVLNVIVNTGKV